MAVLKIALLALLLPLSASWGAIRSDDFAGSGDPSGNWTESRNTMSRNSGDLVGDEGDYNNIDWTADAFAAEQFSEMVISETNGFYVNVSVRGSGTYGSGNWSRYLLVVNPGEDMRLMRWINDNGEDDLGYAGGGRPIAANGDTVRLAIDAAYTLRVYINGVLTWTYVDETAPAALASGTVGVGCYSTASRIASWRGGDTEDHKYYVDCESGSDANSGSIGSPWRTPARFIFNPAVPGDTLFIRGGTCTIDNADTVETGPVVRRFIHIGEADDNGTTRRAPSGTADAWIVIRNYPGETVYVDSASDSTAEGSRPSIHVGSYSDSTAYWKIQGLNLRGNFVYVNSGLGLSTRTHHITFDSMTVERWRYIYTNNHGAFRIDRGDNYGPHEILIQHSTMKMGYVIANGRRYDWNDTNGLFPESHSCLVVLDAESYGGQVGTGTIRFRKNVCDSMYTAFYWKNPSDTTSSRFFYVDSNIFRNVNSIGRIAGSNDTLVHNLFHNVARGLTIGGYGGSTHDSIYAISGRKTFFAWNTFHQVHNLVRYTEYGAGHTWKRNVIFTPANIGASPESIGVFSRTFSDADHNDPPGSIRNSEWYNPGSYEDSNVVVSADSGMIIFNQLLDYDTRRKFAYPAYRDSLERGLNDCFIRRSDTPTGRDSVLVDPDNGDWRLRAGVCFAAGIYGGEEATAPEITEGPAHDTVLAPAAGEFSCQATGNPGPSIQWQRNGVDIPGATEDTYTTPATSFGDDGAQFRCIVSNAAGADTSTAAILTVNAPPVFTLEPSNQAVFVGGQATFTSTAVGSQTITYQWQLSGSDIDGATSSSYTTPVAEIGHNGRQYRVIATNSHGSDTSVVATLTVSVAQSNWWRRFRLGIGIGF